MRVPKIRSSAADVMPESLKAELGITRVGCPEFVVGVWTMAGGVSAGGDCVGNGGNACDEESDPGTLLVVGAK